MAVERPELDDPCYVISVAARMVGLRAQTLRYFERVGLLEPSRSQGNLRLYSPRDVERIRRIKTLMNDMGINLAGVEVILKLMDHIGELEGRLRSLEGELQIYRDRMPPAPAQAEA
ncbi:MAG: MerR family transcriptional regulator [Chloroflexi bacterium]|nr:MerR family transcriptional regulator [Chloroflexota bacterium]